MSSPKKVSTYDPYCKDQGIPYLAAAPAKGIAVFPLLLTQPGASPYAVTFASLGLPNMANANYSVVVGGQTSAQCTEGSKTAQGFTLTGGSAADVINLIVCGQLSGQAA